MDILGSKLVGVVAGLSVVGLLATGCTQDAAPSPSPTSSESGTSVEGREQLKLPEPPATFSADDLCDNGPSLTATGVVSYDAEGNMLSYTVAKGDTRWGVERRLCTAAIFDPTLGLMEGQVIDLTPTR